MKENVLDVLMYLFETYVDAEDDPEPDQNELRIELNIGQYLDILGSVQSIRDVDTAERICRYKSGKYTIERPLHLGAALAAPERLDELLAPLSAYGLPLGDAFQMRDDVMGAFGEEQLTGKPVGGDLREGKPTPLLARAVRRANAEQLAVLAEVGAPGLDGDGVADIAIGAPAYLNANRTHGIAYLVRGGTTGTASLSTASSLPASCVVNE